VTPFNDADQMAGIPLLRSRTPELMNALRDLLDTYRRAAVTEREKDGKGLAVLKKEGTAAH
jgi:hypothetical protein